MGVRHTIGSLACHGLYTSDALVTADQVPKLIKECLDTEKVSSLANNKAQKHKSRDSKGDHVATTHKRQVDAVVSKLRGMSLIIDLVDSESVSGSGSESESESGSKNNGSDMNVDMMPLVKSRVLRSEGYMVVTIRLQDCAGKSKSLRRALERGLYRSVKNAPTDQASTSS